ncbi:uncharacterized protein LOC125178547, partial [Hyalella azteca]|uniref:Uncharacterized protein LOC125178547 n=1 Tax=Hyalella azteca TaxID=294128 RepID=A0A979FNA0_HYAAZ
HGAGRAGGGWDDEGETGGGAPSLVSSLTTDEAGLSSARTSPPLTASAGGALSLQRATSVAEADAAASLVDDVLTSAARGWPVPYTSFTAHVAAAADVDARSLVAYVARRLDDVHRQPLTSGQQMAPLTSGQQMALLTLVDVCVHDDVVSPRLVKQLLLTTLTRLAAGQDVEKNVSTRATRLALETRALAGLCERRDA